ncbi:hypothetical protein D3C87_759870 [compost metagenome]
MNQLPPDTIYEITKFLPVSDLKSLTETNVSLGSISRRSLVPSRETESFEALTKEIENNEAYFKLKSFMGFVNRSNYLDEGNNELRYLTDLDLQRDPKYRGDPVFDQYITDNSFALLQGADNADIFYLFSRDPRTVDGFNEYVRLYQPTGERKHSTYERYIVKYIQRSNVNNVLSSLSLKDYMYAWYSIKELVFDMSRGQSFASLILLLARIVSSRDKTALMHLCHKVNQLRNADLILILIIELAKRYKLEIPVPKDYLTLDNHDITYGYRMRDGGLTYFVDTPEEGNEGLMMEVTLNGDTSRKTVEYITEYEIVPAHVYILETITKMKTSDYGIENVSERRLEVEGGPLARYIIMKYAELRFKLYDNDLFTKYLIAYSDALMTTYDPMLKLYKKDVRYDVKYNISMKATEQFVTLDSSSPSLDGVNFLQLTTNMSTGRPINLSNRAIYEAFNDSNALTVKYDRVIKYKGGIFNPGLKSVAEQLLLTTMKYDYEKKLRVSKDVAKDIDVLIDILKSAIGKYYY